MLYSSQGKFIWVSRGKLFVTQSRPPTVYKRVSRFIVPCIFTLVNLYIFDKLRDRHLFDRRRALTGYLPSTHWRVQLAVSSRQDGEIFGRRRVFLEQGRRHLDVLGSSSRRPWSVLVRTDPSRMDEGHPALLRLQRPSVD